jgi:hypothetical protein
VNAPLPSAELRSRVLAAVRAEPVPSRSGGARRRALLVFVGFLHTAALSLAIGGPAWDSRPQPHTLALGVAWGLVAAVATWAAVARGRSMTGRPGAWSFVVAALTPALLLAAALAAGLAWPSTLNDPAGSRSHIVCLVATPLFALGPLVAFALVRRASDPISPRLTGAAIGAASGAWGSLAIEMHCGHTSLGHVAFLHVSPVVLLALVGLVVGAKVVAVRAEPR